MGQLSESKLIVAAIENISRDPDSCSIALA